MKLKPKRDRLIVKKAPPEEETSGGIKIPELAQQKPQLGYILSVGPGCYTRYGYWKEPPGKEEDIVVFRKYSGKTVKIDGQEFFIIDFDEILSVIEVIEQPDTEDEPLTPDRLTPTAQLVVAENDVTRMERLVERCPVQDLRPDQGSLLPLE